MAPAALTSTIDTFEVDLDMLLRDAKAALGDKKAEVQAARSRVRQVSRRRRSKRLSGVVKSVTRVAPRTAVYGLAAVGLIAFSLAVALLVAGNLPAALPVFTTAGAAWGLARALSR
ncbi:hypothetical protein [Streptomyces puniciscabiei]|uniref:hypothetical protein n=1 Tax=Streptomyces puniciscabiei TaxID=164348 RepID=UPI00332F38E1